MRARACDSPESLVVLEDLHEPRSSRAGCSPTLRPPFALLVSIAAATRAFRAASLSDGDSAFWTRDDASWRGPRPFCCERSIAALLKLGLAIRSSLLLLANSRSTFRQVPYVCVWVEPPFDAIRGCDVLWRCCHQLVGRLNEVEVSAVRVREEVKWPTSLRHRRDGQAGPVNQDSVGVPEKNILPHRTAKNLIQRHAEAPPPSSLTSSLRLCGCETFESQYNGIGASIVKSLYWL